LRNRFCTGFLALAALATAPLHAQDPRLGRLPEATAAAVQRIVDSAVAQELPADPLVLKALEGNSKGADSARIVGAVRLLSMRLTAARQDLGGAATEAELVAAAAALRAGAASASLRTLRALRHDRSLVVPLGVLADLLTAGIPAPEAWSSVQEMATSGASDDQFLALRDRLTSSDAATRPLPPRPERPPLPGPGPSSVRP
jgi:hypothetical protein